MALRKVLIANRGEIALRVLRACRELGLPSASVFSEADRLAPHALAADEALPIGPAAPAESYLSIPRLLEAARRAGCDAVHPGYGFLSESPDFAEAVRGAGLVFVGPPPEVLKRLGDKLGARRLMHEAGLPVAPGSLAATEDPDRLAADARSAGYPVMLKAARGGGGRGIRLVEDEAALRRAVPVAAAEALRAFGPGALYVEKRIAPARHVEVQVFGLASGEVVPLGERECSIQRRHQKLLEETPSPALDPRTRGILLETAARGARAAGYVNAGTMEFLLDAAGGFHFMEMNQRIQVEHAITEMTLGIDLVRCQLLAAGGGDVPLSREHPSPRGHAVEARICAEDPEAGWLPSAGRLRAVSLPSGPFVRVDAAAQSGQEVTLHYDSLLAKVCAWAPSRREALSRLAAALSELRIDGVRTTAGALRRLLDHPGFRTGRYDTGTLESLGAAAPDEDGILAAAVATAMLEHRRREARLLPRMAQADAGAWSASARRAGMRDLR